MDKLSYSDKTLQCFFTLLSAGLREKPANRMLFSMMGDKEWIQILRISEKQTVVGIVWDGMLTLPKELQPSKNVLYIWLPKVLAIEKSNLHIENVLASVTEKMDMSKIPFVLMKGQGTGAFYPNPLHRQCGDIDLYTGYESERAQQVLLSMGAMKEDKHNNRKHDGFIYHGIVIENHYEMEHLIFPPYRRALQSMVSTFFPERIYTRKRGGMGYKVPPSWFEVLFGVLHFGVHLLCIGIGFRHLCDWAILVHSQITTLDKERLQDGLHQLGLENMAATMAELSVQYLEMPENEFAFLRQTGPKTEKYAKILLEDMLHVGNFGQNGIYERLKKDHFFYKLQYKWERNYRFCSFFQIEGFLMPFIRLTDAFQKK